MQPFENLPKEKQDAVLNAGYTAFGRNGYAKTSMAEVAAAAGVSKASLFHYFGSKKNMYLELYRKGVLLTTETLLPALRNLPEDFFERCIVAQRLKTELLLGYPGLFDFFADSIADPHPEVEAGIQQHREAYTHDSIFVFLDGVNWDKFRPGVDAQQVLNMIVWIGTGYTKDHFGKQSPEEIMSGVMVYIDLLRRTVYKEEYL